MFEVLIFFLYEICFVHFSYVCIYLIKCRITCYYRINTTITRTFFITKNSNKTKNRDIKKGKIIKDFFTLFK